MIGIVNAYERHTGLGKYAVSLLYKLRELGKDAGMIFLESAGSENSRAAQDIRFVESVVRQTFSVPKYNSQFAHFYGFPPRIPSGFDLYHLSCQYYARCAKYLNKTILTHMDIAPLLYPQFYSPVERIFYRGLLKFYPRVHSVIVMSEQSKNEVLKFSKTPAHKIKIIPLGYDETLYKPQSKKTAREKLGLPPDVPVALYVGREHSPRKNVRKLLQALNEMRRSIPKLTVIKIGASDPANNVLKADLNIKEFYHVPEEAMPVYYGAADVFIFPSLYEGGYAYPPIEAMACGVPAIVSEECRMYEGGAIVVNANNVQEICRAAEPLLTDASLRETWSQKALEEARKYTLTHQVRMTMNLYDEILA